MRKLNALIAGSTGYIGIQLIKLLVNHKNVEYQIFMWKLISRKKISLYDKKFEI